MLNVYVIKVSQTLTNLKIGVKSLKAQTNNFCFLCSIVLVIEKQKYTWFLSIFCQGWCWERWASGDIDYSSQDAEAFLFCSNFFRKHNEKSRSDCQGWFGDQIFKHLIGEKFSELCFDAFSINYRAIRSKLKCLSI